MARNQAFLFKEFVKDYGDGVHGDLSAATIKVVIINNTTPPTADDVAPRYSSYSANEVSSAGNYVTGGVALTGVTTSYADGVFKFDDTGNISWALDAGGFEDGYWAIVINDTAAADQAIFAVDLGGPVSERTGPFSITWNANGMMIHSVV